MGAGKVCKDGCERLGKGKYLKTVDVCEKFGEEEVLTLSAGKGSLKDGEGTR